MANRQYLVLTAEREEHEDTPGFEDMRTPVLYGTPEEALAFIKGWMSPGDRGWMSPGDRPDRDWMLFEVLDGRCRQLSVVFKDGDPEIEP